MFGVLRVYCAALYIESAGEQHGHWWACMCLWNNGLIAQISGRMGDHDWIGQPSLLHYWLRLLQNYPMAVEKSRKRLSQSCSLFLLARLNEKRNRSGCALHVEFSAWICWALGKLQTTKDSIIRIKSAGNHLGDGVRLMSRLCHRC